MERARAQLKCTLPINGKVEGETLDYAVRVSIQYDAEGQPFTMLDRVERALVDSAYGTMSKHDVIATREERWLPELDFDADKAYELLVALAKGDDDYVEEAKAVASSAAWKLNPRRHRSGALSRRRRTTPYRSISTQEARGFERGRGGRRRDVLHVRAAIDELAERLRGREPIHEEPLL